MNAGVDIEMKKKQNAVLVFLGVCFRSLSTPNYKIELKRVEFSAFLNASRGL